MKITKRQLKRIIKEEKTKLQEAYEYDPASELYDVLQSLSDAHMRIEEVGQHYARLDSEDRRILQMDSIARQVKKIQQIIGTHADRAYKEDRLK